MWTAFGYDLGVKSPFGNGMSRTLPGEGTRYQAARAFAKTIGGKVEDKGRTVIGPNGIGWDIIRQFDKVD